MYVSVASYQFGVLERQGKPDGGSPSSSAQPRVVPRRSQLRRCLGVTHEIIAHLNGDRPIRNLDDAARLDALGQLLIGHADLGLAWVGEF